MGARGAAGKKSVPRRPGALAAVIMNNLRLGVIDHLKTGLAQTPAQISVFKIQKKTVIKIADSAQGRGANKQKRTQQPVHLSDGIFIKIGHQKTVQIFLAEPSAQKSPPIKRRQ